MNHMHFTVGVANLHIPIPVYKDEIRILGFIMTQLSLKEWLKQFGERGI